MGQVCTTANASRELLTTHHRSVDNIRIERLWVDVTQGIGNKWYNFFAELEHQDGLRPSDNWHLWLLHYLFLDAINIDLSTWADAWNNHPMDIARSNRDISLHTSESPLSMYQYGLIQNGVRGFDLPSVDAEPEPVDDDALEQYGVDWAALNERHILRSNRRNNANLQHELHHGPHRPRPAQMSSVEVLPPNCPFPDLETVEELYQYLADRVDLSAVDMISRRHWWVTACTFCADYVARNRVE